MGNVAIRQSAYDFLIDFNRKYAAAAILYRFRDIASYLSKVADFYPPHLHLAPCQEGGFYCLDSASSLYYKGSASLNGTINLGVCA